MVSCNVYLVYTRRIFPARKGYEYFEILFDVGGKVENEFIPFLGFSSELGCHVDSDYAVKTFARLPEAE